jgi:hypothetical protein
MINLRLFLCAISFTSGIWGLRYIDIAQENLKSIIELNAIKPNAPENLEDDERNYYQIYQDELKRQSHLSSSSKRKLIYSLLADYEKVHTLESTHVIDKKTCQDLELLSGSLGSPTVYIGAKLDRTHLEIGRVIFLKKLVEPLADYTQLKQHGALLKELINNTQLCQLCDKQLASLKTAENIFLSLWDENDVFNNQLHYFTIKLPFTKKNNRIQKLSAQLNKNKYMLEINDKLNLFNTGMANLMALAGAVILPLYGISKLSDHKIAEVKLAKLKKDLDLSSSGAVYTIPGALSYMIMQLPNKQNYAVGVASIITGLTFAKDAWLSRTALDDHVTFKKCLHIKLMHCTSLLTTIRNLIDHLKANPVIIQNWPQLTEFNLTENNAELIQLLDNLHDDIFRHPASAISPAGIVFATYKLLLQVKTHLIKAFIKLGEIDALMSIAKLYLEFKNKHNSFCFPEFIDPEITSSPVMKAHKFWNPNVPGKVIANTIVLGGDQPRSLVVTGPNEGGKSTIAAKGIPLTLLLAQSLGIAPAQALICTPVTKIYTCLRVTDNTALGNSYFKASVLRAREIFDMTTMLKPHQYALTAVDEIFNGTNFEEGQQAAYRFIELIGKNLQTMCIATTHFSMLTQLAEKTGNFANYKVSIDEQAGMRTKYSYTLEKGISQQTVALTILKEQGFGPFPLKPST